MRCPATMELQAPGTGGYGTVELECELPQDHERAHKDTEAGIHWYPVRP